MLNEATPLFIASVYAQPYIVQWLLAHGADRTSRCYNGRIAIDLVGECCEASVDVRVTSNQTAEQPRMSDENVGDSLSKVTTLVQRSAMCRRLLTDHPSLPDPPMDHVQITCHVATQVVVTKSTPISKSGESEPIRKQQMHYKCLVDVTWATPLSNGSIIEKYEVQYRITPNEDIYAIGENIGGDPDDTVNDDAGEQTMNAVSDSMGSWRLERVNHNRKTQQQGVVIEGLEFNSRYEFMIRSWNAVGKGEWSRLYKVRTQQSPSTS